MRPAGARALAAATGLWVAAAAPPGALAGPDDPCSAGLAHERAGDLPRAHLALQRCLASAGEAAPAEAQAARARVVRGLAASDHAPVSFSVKPAGVALRIPPFTSDAPLGEPYVIWLPPGRHAFTASAPGYQDLTGTIEITGRERLLLTVALEPLPDAPSSTTVDFGEDGPAVDDAIVTPDPRPKKHKTLIPERFRRGLTARPGAGPRARRRAYRWPTFFWWGS
ncbi:MAG TPA: hypothetical protein VKZ63_00285 [Kofleriaceae bacterium]|nr:hypothetical protein [Kofleriaceae bacterium]